MLKSKNIASKLHLSFFSLLLLLLSSIVTQVNAADEDIKTIAKRLENDPAVRQQFLLRNSRFLVGLGLGNSIGSPFRSSATIGIDIGYFLSDKLSIGLNAFYGLPRLTYMGEQIVTQYDLPKYKGNYTEENFTATTFSASFELTYVPIIGKMSFLGQSNQKYDIFMIGGIGAVGLTGANVAKDKDFSALAIAPVLGLGMRIFVSQSLAISISLRNYIYSSIESTAPVVDIQNLSR
jgi:outer membrane beta-barrel protein